MTDAQLKELAKENNYEPTYELLSFARLVLINARAQDLAAIAMNIRAAVRQEREECAGACEDIELDQWALYKGRPPYKGNEDGRADMYVQGVSDGAGRCVAAIRARGQA